MIIKEIARRITHITAALVLVLFGAQQVAAATATIEGLDAADMVKTVQGTWVYNTKVSFDEPGAYKLTLTNFSFPTAFDAVGVMVSSAKQKVVDIISYDTVGSLSKFFNASEGAYYLSIFAVSDRQLNLGTFGIAFDAATPAEVPLPPALVLLMSGAMTLMAFVRRKRAA